MTFNHLKVEKSIFFIINYNIMKANIWKSSLSKLHQVKYWENTEAPSSKYTALASYTEIKNGQVINKGKCLDINSKNTIANKICTKKISNNLSKFTKSKFIYTIIFFNIIGIFCILSTLFNYNHKHISIIGGLFWIVIPLILFLDSNITILRKIWCQSFKPWFHFYSSLLETIAFCDLCTWDFRSLVIFPAFLFNQINIINSDAVYFKLDNCNKKIPLIQIILSILWKVLILYCLRFGYFYNIKPRNIVILTSQNNMTNSTNTLFHLNNASLFFTKSMALSLFLIGQIYFKCKYSNKLYSLHTHYTIKKNKEWNLINRKERIFKKMSLNGELINMKKLIFSDNLISIKEVSI